MPSSPNSNQINDTVNNAPGAQTSSGAAAATATKSEIERFLQYAQQLSSMSQAQQDNFIASFRKFIQEQKDSLILLQSVEKISNIFCTAATALNASLGDHFRSKAKLLAGIIELIDAIIYPYFQRKAEYIKARPHLICIATELQNNFLYFAGCTTDELMTQYCCFCLRELGEIARIMIRFDNALAVQAAVADDSIASADALFEFLSTRKGLDLMTSIITHDYRAPIYTLSSVCRILESLAMTYQHQEQSYSSVRSLRLAKTVLEHPSFRPCFMNDFEASHVMLLYLHLPYVSQLNSNRSCSLPFLESSQNVSKLLAMISEATKNAASNDEEDNMFYSAFRITPCLMRFLERGSQCDSKALLRQFIMDGRALKVCRTALDTFSDGYMRLYGGEVEYLLIVTGNYQPLERPNANKLQTSLDERMKKVAAPSLDQPKASRFYARQGRVCSWYRKLQANLPAGQKLKACSRCHLAYYCDAECQKKHWAAQHKKTCIPQNTVRRNQVAGACCSKKSANVISQSWLHMICRDLYL